jgi:integrase
MKDACEAAAIEPLGFHQLRHTYASLYLMSGGSLVALAKQLGHTTTRMVEKHYGHLADSWRAEEARKHAPSLGMEPVTVGKEGSEVESA